MGVWIAPLGSILLWKRVKLLAVKAGAGRRWGTCCSGSWPMNWWVMWGFWGWVKEADCLRRGWAASVSRIAARWAWVGGGSWMAVKRRVRLVVSCSLSVVELRVGGPVRR